MAQSVKEIQIPSTQTVFETFDPDSMDIMVYIEQYGIFSEMIGISQDKKVITFIASMDHQLYTL